MEQKHEPKENTGAAGPAKKRAGGILAAAGKAGLVLTVLLLAAAAAIGGVLQSETIRSRILDLALAKASAGISGRISASGIEGDFLTGFRLKNLIIEEEAGPVFSVETATVRYWLPSLLGDRWLVHSLTLEKPVLTCVRGPDGIWNVQRLFPGAGAPVRADARKEVPKVTIRRLRLAGGSLRVDANGAETPPPVRIDALFFDARVSTGSRFTLALRSLSFDAASPVAISLKMARGRLAYHPEKKRLTAEAFYLATGESELAVDGQVDFSGRVQFVDLTAASEGIQLSEVARVSGARFLSAGRANGRVRLSGPLSELSCRADIGLAPARLKAEGRILGLFSGAPVFDLSASVDRLDPAALPLAANPAPAGDLNGDLTARFSIAGHLPEGEATLRLRPSRLSGLKVRSGTVRAKIAGSRLQAAVTGLTTGIGRFTGQGEVRGVGLQPALLAFGAEVNAEALNPGRLVGDERFDGALSGTVRAEGQISARGAGAPMFEAIEARVYGSLDRSQMAGIPVAGARFDLQWDGRRAAISSLSVASAGAAAAASGTVDTNTREMDIDFSADSPDVGKFFEVLVPLFPALEIPRPLAGDLSISTRISGTWDRPQASGTLAGRGLAVGRAEAGAASADFRWTGGPADYRLDTRFAAESVEVNDRPIERVQGAGTVTPGRIDARLDLEATRPERLRLEAAGSVADWQGPVRSVDLGQFALFAAGFSVQNDGALRLKIHPDRVDIDELALVSGEARLSASGRLTPEKAEGLKIVLSSLSLSRFDRFLPESLPVEGLAEARAVLTGTLDAPRITADVRVADGRIGDVAFSEMTAAALPEKDGVRIDAALVGAAGQRAAIQGMVPVRFSLSPAAAGWTAGRFDLRFSLGQWRLDELPYAEEIATRIEGAITVSGRLSGAPAAPAAALDAVVSDGRFAVPESSGERIGFSRLALEAGLENGRATVRAAMTKQERSVAALSAELPVTFSLKPLKFEPGKDGLDARLLSEGLPISSLPIPKRFGIEADGKLRLDLRASGSVGSPALSGTMAVDGGSLALPRYGLSYEQVSIKLHMENERLTVASLSLAGDSEGSITFTGRIGLDGTRPVRFDLKVAGDNLLIPYRGALTARVRPQLSLLGPASAPALSGELTILDSRLNLDRLSDQGPAEIQVIGEAEGDSGQLVIDPGAENGPPFLKPMSADVEVAIPKNSWMRGQGLNVEIGGEIRLKKDAGGPFTLAGSLSVIRGFYVFQGKRFTIDEGTVVFVGLEEPNPSLNIEASSRIKDATIYVGISGTARDLRLSLDSDPAMDPAEIVSYVVFGKSSEDIKAGEAINAEQAALKMAGQLTASQLNDVFGDAFVLDTIYFDPGGGDLGQGTLSMGKYLTSELFVSYRQSFDLKQLHQLEVAYELTPNLDLETVIGDDKGYGVDLFWKMDY